MNRNLLRRAKRLHIRKLCALSTIQMLTDGEDYNIFSTAYQGGVCIIPYSFQFRSCMNVLYRHKGLGIDDRHLDFTNRFLFDNKGSEADVLNLLFIGIYGSLNKKFPVLFSERKQMLYYYIIHCIRTNSLSMSKKSNTVKGYSINFPTLLTCKILKKCNTIKHYIYLYELVKCIVEKPKEAIWVSKKFKVQDNLKMYTDGESLISAKDLNIRTSALKQLQLNLGKMEIHVYGIKKVLMNKKFKDLNNAEVEAIRRFFKKNNIPNKGDRVRYGMKVWEDYLANTRRLKMLKRQARRDEITMYRFKKNFERLVEGIKEKRLYNMLSSSITANFLDLNYTQIEEQEEEAAMVFEEVYESILEVINKGILEKRFKEWLVNARENKAKREEYEDCLRVMSDRLMEVLMHVDEDEDLIEIISEYTSASNIETLRKICESNSDAIVNNYIPNPTSLVTSFAVVGNCYYTLEELSEMYNKPLKGFGRIEDDQVISLDVKGRRRRGLINMKKLDDALREADIYIRVAHGDRSALNEWYDLRDSFAEFAEVYESEYVEQRRLKRLQQKGNELIKEIMNDEVFKFKVNDDDHTQSVVHFFLDKKNKKLLEKKGKKLMVLYRERDAYAYICDKDKIPKEHLSELDYQHKNVDTFILLRPYRNPLFYKGGFDYWARAARFNGQGKEIFMEEAEKLLETLRRRFKPKFLTEYIEKHSRIKKFCNKLKDKKRFYDRITEMIRESEIRKKEREGVTSQLSEVQVGAHKPPKGLPQMENIESLIDKSDPLCRDWYDMFTNEDLRKQWLGKQGPKGFMATASSVRDFIKVYNELKKVLPKNLVFSMSYAVCFGKPMIPKPIFDKNFAVYKQTIYDAIKDKDFDVPTKREKGDYWPYSEP